MPEHSNDKMLAQIASLMQSPQARRIPALVAMWNDIQIHPTKFKIKSLLDMALLHLGEMTPANQIRPVQRNDPLLEGDIHAGFCLQTQQPLCLSMQDLFRHMIVVGVPGSGKTTWIRFLINQLLGKHIPMIVFQKKRNQFEYCQASSRFPITFTHLTDLRIALFEPASDSKNSMDQRPIELIHNLFQRQDSRTYSYKAFRHLQDRWIDNGNYPTIADLIESLDALKTNSRETQIKSSIRRVYEWLWNKNEIFHARVGMYQALKQRATVIQYDSSEEHIVWLVAFWIAERLIEENSRKPDHEKSPLLIIIDDAQELIEQNHTGRLPLFVNYMNVARENKIGILLMFQHIQGIEPQVLTSAGSMVLGKIYDHREARLLVEINGLAAGQKVSLTSQTPGMFLMRSPRSEGVVQFYAPDMQTNIPSDQSQWEWNNKNQFASYTYAPWQPNPTPKTQSTSSSGDELRFLYEIFNHPYWNASELKNQLQLSPQRFSRIQKELTDQHLIIKHQIGKYHAFEISAAGYQTIHQTPPRHKGGFVHYFAIRRMEHFFQTSGWHTQAEEALSGSSHLIDLVARKNGLALAVEFETGQSFIMNNIHECIQSVADKVFCVRPSKQAKQNTEKSIQSDSVLTQKFASGILEIHDLQFMDQRIPTL